MHGSMRIAIDARMMSPLVTRGIGRYIEELVRAMVGQLSSQDRLILCVRDLDASPFLHHPLVEHLLADVPWYSIREQLRMSRIFSSARADLVHVPHWNVPWAYRGPLVVTIHDLLLRHQPGSAKASTRDPITAFLKRTGHRFLLQDVMRKARRIFIPTQFVAHDVQKLYPFTKDKLVVTSEGISAFPLEDLHLVPPHPYLLYVGSAYPHKRLDVLCDAWKNLAIRYPNHELLIAGEEDIFMARYVSQVMHQHIPRVRFLGRISDAELVALYRHATVFIFPSSYEGFGLPPLEALAQGTPVVSSDASCLPEVLDMPGVFFFRNGDVNGMIRAIDAVLSDTQTARSLATRAQASLHSRFSWSSVARCTLDVYERIAHS